MSKIYDATTKELIERFPIPWMTYLGLTARGPVLAIDADLSTITAEADKVFRVEAAQPYLVHVEMQSSTNQDLPRRLLRYHVLLDYRHDLRVESVVLLLRPAADADNLTGVLELRHPDGRRTVEFHYRVVRAWQQPVDSLLEGGLGTLPLAPLADVPASEMRAVIQKIDERLQRETTSAISGTIRKATILLAGLRFPKLELAAIFEGLQTMDLWKDSSLREIFIDEGLEMGLERGREQGREQGRREEGLRMILRQGQVRFGTPDLATRQALEAIETLDRLEDLGERLLLVSSWAELLSKS